MKNPWNKTITFDRFVRWILIALLVVGILLLLRRLSSVLLPFFIGWFIAYLMNPLVNFFQYRCRFKYRIFGIIAAFVVVGGVLWGAFMLIFPPMWNEVLKVKGMLVAYLQNSYNSEGLMAIIHQWLSDSLSVEKLRDVFTFEGFYDLFKESMPKVWEFLTGSFKAFSTLFTVVMVLLYTLFILIDYDRLSRGFRTLLPKSVQAPVSRVLNDLDSGMNKYFKGQALIALCVGILFCIGFLIIGFPMAVALGLFIGLLNMVPYLQIVGFIPTLLLAAVKAANTGENFWLIVISALAVFAVVSGLFSKKIYENGLWAFPAVILAQLSGRAVFLGLVAIFQSVAPFTVEMIWSQILTGWVGLAIQAVLVPLLIIGIRAILVKDND